MQLAHKIRLIPIPEQEEYFRKACGTARFVYNWGLAQVKAALEAGQKPEGHLALKKRLNGIKREQFPWMLEVTKCAPEAALANLGQALSNFFASRKGKRKGRKIAFPKFKKKGKSKDSFYVSNDKFTVSGKSIRLPHIGEVAMTEENPIQHKSHVRVGIDLGLKTAVAVSTGKTFDAPKPLKRHLKRLARLNRRLHRRMPGSANRRKAVQAVARLHERIANIRRDWLHKVTTYTARRYSFVAIEDLNVAAMAQAKNRGRAIADVGMGEIGRMLAYKVLKYGGRLVKISRWYPSSKTCLKCGFIKKDLTLADRSYICDKCGHAADRDLNAARNILREGIRQVS